MSSADLVRRTNSTVSVVSTQKTGLMVGATVGVLAAVLLPFWLIVIAAVAGGYFYFKG